jgi:hypothetical protein
VQPADKAGAPPSRGLITPLEYYGASSFRGHGYEEIDLFPCREAEQPLRRFLVARLKFQFKGDGFPTSELAGLCQSSWRAPEP